MGVLNKCIDIIRKVRSDKGKDRWNTTTKYLVYSVLSFIAWSSIVYSLFPRVEEKIKYITLPQDVYIDRVVEKIEYVPLECDPVTKDNQ